MRRSNATRYWHISRHEFPSRGIVRLGLALGRGKLLCQYVTLAVSDGSNLFRRAPRVNLKLKSPREFSEIAPKASHRRTDSRSAGRKPTVREWNASYEPRCHGTSHTRTRSMRQRGASRAATACGRC